MKLSIGDVLFARFGMSSYSSGPMELGNGRKAGNRMTELKRGR